MALATKLYLFFSLVLLACSATTCLALKEHVCISDWIPSRIGKTTPTPTQAIENVSNDIHAVPSEVSEEGFAPLRIKVFFEDQYCKEFGPHPKTKDRNIGRRYQGSCLQTDILTPEKVKLLTDKIIPAAAKLHTDRLLVKPIKGVKIPAMKGICAEFTIPAEHMKSGVEGADMVLYLSALPTFASDSAWATTCATLDGRPVVGVINVGPDLIVDTHQSVRVVAHAMAHALGFTSDKLKELKMTTTKENVRGKTSVTMVTSSKTVEMTKQHFDCETAEGMELEDESITMPIPSHWERRNAKDELMSAINGIGYYTALTMAAFHDMGFYRANFSNAEPMSWGNKSSCTLLTDACIANGETKYPSMFCTAPSAHECTSDRLGLGACTFIRYLTAVPEWHRYFNNTRASGDKYNLMDYCPIIEPKPNTMCADGEEELMPGSLVGLNSRCFTGRGLVFNKKSIGGVCAKILCKEGNVLLKLRGDTEWRSCPEGTEISAGESLANGTIQCPKYAELCTVTDPLIHAVVNDGDGDKQHEAQEEDRNLPTEDKPDTKEGATKPKESTVTRQPKQKQVSIDIKTSGSNGTSLGTFLTQEGLFGVGDGSVRAAIIPALSLAVAVAVVSMTAA